MAAIVTTGHTFSDGETVTHTKINNAVNQATISGIVDAEISASAAIALSKLDTSDDLDLTGNLKVGTNGVDISQIRHGTANISASTSVTVSDTTITANSLIFLTPQGNPGGDIYEDSATRVVGTSFDIKCSASTTVTVAYMIIEP